MEELIKYLALSGILTVLMWIPYILARVFTWGLPTFLNNYPSDKYPLEDPEPPMWAVRAKRAHLNMVETMPAFVAVVLAVVLLADANVDQLTAAAGWAGLFFNARLAHMAIYIFGIPYLRTPSYLVSWFAILMIGFSALQ